MEQRVGFGVASQTPRAVSCLHGGAHVGRRELDDFHVVRVCMREVLAVVVKIAEAAIDGQEVAVVFGREETTYLELESRANRLARHLGARGVRRGSLVAMLLPRSVDADREALKAERCERLPRDLVRAGPRDLCYVIT